MRVPVPVVAGSDRALSVPEDLTLEPEALEAR